MPAKPLSEAEKKRRAYLREQKKLAKLYQIPLPMDLPPVEPKGRK